MGPIVEVSPYMDTGSISQSSNSKESFSFSKKSSDNERGNILSSSSFGSKSSSSFSMKSSDRQRRHNSMEPIDIQSHRNVVSSSSSANSRASSTFSKQSSEKQRGQNQMEPIVEVQPYRNTKF